jgi:N6-adenosine-specific RNA methylase IME4
MRPVGGFNVVYIDPPWHFDTHSEKGQEKSPSKHYQTMPAGEILALPVPTLLADNAAVYCWTTIPHLELGMLCLTAWGVTYRGHRAWPKARQTMGYWAMGKHEILLIGAKGAGICPKPGTRPTSLIGEPDQREHSRKPDRVVDELDRAHPGARKVEIFGRTQAPGWAAWGNELGRFQRDAVEA